MEQPQLRSIKPVEKAEVPRYHFDSTADTLGTEAEPLGPPRRQAVGAGLDAFVLRDVLAPRTCKQLVDLPDRLGYTFWHPHKVGAESKVL